MTATINAKIIAVAAEIAGTRERGIEPADFHEAIVEHMHTRGVPEAHYEDVQLLVSAFIGFSQSVRAAERKGKPIIRYLGEVDLPASS